MACFDLFLLLFLAPQSQDAELLKEAQRLLFTNQEPVARKGARACLSLNSADSMKLLLRRLNGDQPHYRDIVWEVIPQFTDPYARELVALELKNKRKPFLRQWAAQALGLYGDATFGPALMKAMKDKDIGVQRAVAQALGRVALSKAIGVLRKEVKDKDPILRTNAIAALLALNAEESIPAFQKGLRDKHPGVRTALLALVARHLPNEAETWSCQALEDDDWRVQLQGVENLQAATPTKSAVDALIPALSLARPLVQSRIVSLLQDWSGVQYRSRSDWARWWKENRAEAPLEKGRGQVGLSGDTVATYNGLRVESDHVAFLMDVSSGMDEFAGNGQRKRDLALEELKKTLESLPETVTFSVFVYSSEVEAWNEKPVLLTKKNAKHALNFVRKARSRGWKNIWAAVSAVLDEPTLDTVFLLSSGEPEVGLYVHHNRVVDHLVDQNRFRKLTVHSVVYSDSTWYQDQLRFISKGTGGSFVAIE